jgi:hypothetical protein
MKIEISILMGINKCNGVGVPIIYHYPLTHHEAFVAVHASLPQAYLLFHLPLLNPSLHLLVFSLHLLTLLPLLGPCHSLVPVLLSTIECSLLLHEYLHASIQPI